MSYKIGQPVMWRPISMTDEYVFGIILDKTESDNGWIRYRVAFADGDDQWFSAYDTKYFVNGYESYLKGRGT